MASYTDQAILVSKAQLTPAQAKAALAKQMGSVPPDVAEYVDTIYTVAPRLNLNPDLLLGQAILETDWFTSSWWKNRHNPGGLGVTGDPQQDAASQDFKTGRGAGLGQIAHMLAYVDPVSAEERFENLGFGDVRSADKRFDSPINANYTAQTLRGLGQVRQVDGKWVGWSANDPTYGEKIAGRINQVLAKANGGPIPMPEEPKVYHFGRAKHPPFIDAIANKDGGGGYDRVGPRQIIGACTHEWMGAMNIDGVRRFFSCPSGERCGNALVDYTVMKDGTLIRLNDPLGTRSPWASGGGVESGGPEGDGPAFIAKFGIGAINARLVSVEVMKLDNEQYTEAQIDMLGQLYAYWYDRDGQKWDQHPFTDKYGIVMSFLHYEFGTTNCGIGENDDIAKVQAATKAYMKRAQEDAGPVPPDPDPVPPKPIPPDVPQQPPVQIPGGLSVEEATKRFGRVTKHNLDGTTSTGGFDRNGLISLAWAHRAAQENTWPSCEDWYVLNDSGKTLDVITFSNNWRLMRFNERQGFQWVATVV